VAIRDMPLLVSEIERLRTHLDRCTSAPTSALPQ
jgi:hypothetical protein